MNTRTRERLNKLRRPMLDFALRKHDLTGRYQQIGFAHGFAGAVVAKREARAEARAKGRVARASRKRNRR